MALSKDRCLRVQFFEPVGGKTDYYFGSIKAIYTMFEAPQIGIAMATLYTRKLTESSPVVTDRCRITRIEITRMKRKEL
jgi:hypothetical protein